MASPVNNTVNVPNYENFNSIDRMSQSAEKWMRRVAIVPILGSVPAAIGLGLLGGAQKLGGNIGQAAYGIASLFNNKRHLEFEAKAIKCVEYQVQGWANMEKAPFYALSTLPSYAGELVGRGIAKARGKEYQPLKIEYKGAEKYAGNGFDTLDECSRTAEKWLARAERVPLLNIVAGLVHQEFALNQIINGLAGAALFQFASICNNDRQIEFEAKAHKCLEYAKHGVANLGLALFTTIFTRLPIDLFNYLSGSDHKMDYTKIKVFDQKAEAKHTSPSPSSVIDLEKPTASGAAQPLNPTVSSSGPSGNAESSFEEQELEPEFLDDESHKNLNATLDEILAHSPA